MKITLFVLGLLVASVSSYTREILPQSIHFKADQIYKYDYSGQVLTGLPASGSSFYSGHQLNSTIELTVIKTNGGNIVKMELTKIVLGQLLEEVSEVEKAIFTKEELKRQALDILSLPVQFYFNPETDSFVYVEVQKTDAPWSVNIKKSIIDLFQLNFAGKLVQRSAKDSLDAVNIDQTPVNDGVYSFGGYESTMQGECETNYQIVQAADPAKLQTTLPGSEKSHFTVIKTRNFYNCVYQPSLTSHNWDRKGCIEYCKRFTGSTHLGMKDLNKHIPIPDEIEPNCNCDPKEAYPIDQYSTIRYNITIDSVDPIISEALGKGKIVVDNHGTKFVVYSQHSIKFVSEQIKKNVPLIPSESVIRVNDLVFTLFPYKGMEDQAYPSHVIPVYNLLIPKNTENLYAPTVDLFDQVAKIVMEGGSKETQSKASWFMVRIIQNLAHFSTQDIQQIYNELAEVEEKDRFTNTERSVVRQLFLDALAHVGTKASAEWFKTAVDSKSLSAYEVRQFAETLPQNVYAPSKTLLGIFKEQMNMSILDSDYGKLSAFAVSYGKLISKACRLDEKSNLVDENSAVNRYTKGYKNLVERRGAETPTDWPEADERCTQVDAESYISDLVEALEKVPDLKAKVILAQALTHSGQYKALEKLTPYITGALKDIQCVGYVNGSSASDCIFLRSSIIYALHHMVPVSPKLLRSLTLNIFQNKYEPYELRLAAFTVFMAAGPKPHELEGVAVTLRGEKNRQIITMVRSVLEETANLTQACHLPLATAAREIISTLPVFNFDGVYSKASYNEWYSEDKSTGFFLNGQYVANNVSFIPRHGYLALGSHWKSLTNSWLTIAYQQKGLESILLRKIEQIFSPEWFFATLSKSGKTRVEGEKPIDEIFKTLGITERSEEDAKVKLFVKLYEQTSLFTLDKWTIEAAFKQFNTIVKNFIGQVNTNTNYNFVRFFMPSSYSQIIPSDLGLPVVVLKQRPHIVALRIEGAHIQPEIPSLKSSVSIEATLVPQVYYTSSMSVSVFQHGLKKNYGAYSLKKTTVYVPLRVTFNFEASTRSLTYSVEPTLDTKVFHSSNSNRAFQAINYIGIAANESPIFKRRVIETRVPAYYTNPRFQSRELGMDLEVSYQTERPWFFDVEKIPTKGFPTWIIEKYAELNEYNYDVALTLRANKKYRSAGIAGSFDYNFALAGDYKEVKLAETTSLVHERSMLKKLDRHETRSVRITKDEIRKVAEAMVYNYPGTIVNRKAPTLTRALNWSFRTLSQEDASLYNATLYFIQSLDYQTYWVKYVSTLEKSENTYYGFPRVFQVEASLALPALPSELKWEVPQLNKFVGKYVANVTWGENFNSINKVDRILVSGILQRTQKDEVVGEMMKSRSWYHEQCLKDIKSEVYMSYACQVVAQEQSYFNKITGTIEFDSNLDSSIVNSTSLIYQAGKLYLNSYWRPWSTIASYFEKNVDGKVTFEAKHSNAIFGRPVVNFEVRTPRETSLWYKLFFPIERFTSFHPIMYRKASVLPKDQICGLMVNHIRTFDNVTFEKPSTKCEYLLSMDCSPARRFAVTVKEVNPMARLVKVIVGQQVILVHSIDKYQANIEVNGEQKYVKPGQSHVINRANEILAVRIFLQNAYLVIELPQEHVRVVTDGRLVKVVTSPLYLGKTCGLCGNQDQEAHMELQGPENCIYENIGDFQNAYSLGECHDTPPTVPPTCGLVQSFSSRKQQRDQLQNKRRIYNKEQLLTNNKLQRNAELRESMDTRVAHLMDDSFENGAYLLPVRRTLALTVGDKNCLSKHVVPTCYEDEQPLYTYEMVVPLACFSRNHPISDKWIADAEERVVSEVTLYPTTLRTYNVPILCHKEATSTRGI